MGDISRNFSYSEFERSQIAADNGIDNRIPNEKVKANIRGLVLSVIQPLRDDLGAPVYISSGWRCEELNKLVDGAEDSQHKKGEASDIKCPFFSPLDMARRIVALRLPFDQLILYPTFIHVSHKLKGKQRGRVLYNRRYTGEKV